MLASEAIIRLEELISEHGDSPLYNDDIDGKSCQFDDYIAYPNVYHQTEDKCQDIIFQAHYNME